MKAKKVAVIGLGYIGLPTAAVIASKGTSVIGVDIDTRVVQRVNKGRVPFIEPGLEKLVEKVVAGGYLTATDVTHQADIYIIAVPTPFKICETITVPEPDVSHIRAAVESIGPFLKRGDLVILESTSPIGTTQWMTNLLAELRPDLCFPGKGGESVDVNVAYCPERVIPGSVLRELVQNDRVVGGITKRCAEQAVYFYQSFVLGDCVATTARTAEMTKLVENASRDAQIAFANELSMICADFEVNVWELISLANRHPRVDILKPGPGVGGHCISVDPWFLVHAAPKKANLIRTARDVNNQKPRWVVAQVQQKCDELLSSGAVSSLENITIACYGITFKPNIDDLRNSPAKEIVETLSRVHPGALLVVEPNIKELPTTLARAQKVTLEQATAVADLHVQLINHREFEEIRLEQGVVLDIQGTW